MGSIDLFRKCSEKSKLLINLTYVIDFTIIFYDLCLNFEYLITL